MPRPRRKKIHLVQLLHKFLGISLEADNEEVWEVHIIFYIGVRSEAVLTWRHGGEQFFPSIWQWQALTAHMNVGEYWNSE